MFGVANGTLQPLRPVLRSSRNLTPHRCRSVRDKTDQLTDFTANYQAPSARSGPLVSTDDFGLLWEVLHYRMDDNEETEGDRKTDRELYQPAMAAATEDNTEKLIQ